LTGNGGTYVLIHEEAVDSAVEFLGGDGEGLGEGVTLGKGIAAPPRAACCSIFVGALNENGNAGTRFANTTPRMNGMMYGLLQSQSF
jgi:hypothetical protein